MLHDVLQAAVEARSAASVQSESFNHLLNTTLRKIVNERYQHSTVNTQGDAMMTATYRNLHVGPPVSHEAHGSERAVDVLECIRRRLPYVFSVNVGIVVERYLNADAKSGVNVWDAYDPVTGTRVAEVHPSEYGDDDDALHGTSGRAAHGQLTVDGVAHGGSVAPALQAVSMRSTDNPKATHHFAEEAAQRALDVRWVLTEVHHASSQCIMELPAQVGSEVCITSRMPLLFPNAAWQASGEIVPNGTYRMVVQQRRVQVNRTLTTRLRGGGVQSQIRSVLEHRHRSTSTLYVKLFPDWQSSERVRAWVQLPYVKEHVPLMALFRLLGVRTTAHAAQMIASGGQDASPEPWMPGDAYHTPDRLALREWVHDLLRPVPVFTKRKAGRSKVAPPPKRGDTSANAAAEWTVTATGSAVTHNFPDFEAMSREEVGEWVSMRSCAGTQYNQDAKWLSTLSTETLPQLGLGMSPEMLTNKAMLLAYAVWKAARVARGDAEPDERDALGNNYYATAGELTVLLLRQCVRRLVKAVAMTMRNNPMRSAQIADYLRKRTVTDAARYAFNTGNWGESKGAATASQQETTQQRPQGNLLSQRTHLTTLRTPLRDQSKNADARKLHPSYFGFICPAAHSESITCGLRVHLTALAHITCGQDAQTLIPLVVSHLTAKGDACGFVPTPMPSVTSGKVARPQRPTTTSAYDVTKQHMVRVARHQRKRVFTQTQLAYQLQTLRAEQDSVDGESGAAAASLAEDSSIEAAASSATRALSGAADGQETASAASVVASMKWPGSAAASASAVLHEHSWDASRERVQAHAHTLRRAKHVGILVMVNGIPIGTVAYPAAAAHALRECRRAGWISRDVEIAVRDQGTVLWIAAQSGELRRPMWVCRRDPRTGQHSMDIAAHEWRAWRASNGELHELWQRLLAVGCVEYIGPNEVRNARVHAEAWTRVDAACTHAELHPGAMLSGSVGCLPHPQHNQGPRNAYYHALSNSTITETPPVAGNDTTINALVSPAQRYVRTCMERGAFPMGYGAGAVVMVAVMCAGDNVEDSMVLQREAVAGGMLASTETHTYTATAARGPAALRKTECKVYGVPHAGAYAARDASYAVLEKDGLPRVGSVVPPGSAIVGLQRRTRCADTTPGARRHPVTGQWVTSHDGSAWTSARDVPCVVSDVRISPSLKVGQTMAVVQTTSLRLFEVGDKLAVSPSQKGTVATLRCASDMPVSPTLGRPHVIMNPHAIPSRMTQGKDVEGIVAMAALLLGMDAADGTAWTAQHTQQWAEGVLREHGVSPHGCHTFYDGVTGRPLRMRVFAVPQFVSRLKQMAANKISMRATGPVNQLTGQATEGRAVGGGQRLGSMENDALTSCGATAVLQERFRDAADGVTAWVCAECCALATPPAPAAVAGTEVSPDGTLDPSNVRWAAHFVADTHARCPVCGSSDAIVRVRVRRALLLLIRELAVAGILMRLHVSKPGSSMDTLQAPSPCVLRAIDVRGGRVPQVVPQHVVLEAARRVKCAVHAGTAVHVDTAQAVRAAHAAQAVAGQAFDAWAMTSLEEEEYEDDDMDLAA